MMDIFLPWCCHSLIFFCTDVCICHKCVSISFSALWSITEYAFILFPCTMTIRGVKPLGVVFIFFWLHVNLVFIFLPNLCGHGGVLSVTLFSRFLGFQLFDHFHVTVQILHLSKFILKLDSLIQIVVHTGTFFLCKTNCIQLIDLDTAQHFFGINSKENWES